jgi:sugar phosphate isomerase/epimerase
MSRLSLNSKTTNSWSLPELVEGCRAAGIDNVGLWRELYDGADVDAAGRMVADAGLTVTTLCRGGFFPTDDEAERNARARDNLAAVDECVALGTSVLVLVCGGLSGRDLVGSRQQVADGVGALARHAADRGVRLAVEPLHPMYCADRSVVSTLEHALKIAGDHSPDVVGVCVDTFHLWWDDRAVATVPTIGPSIAAYQVCDWLDPLPDVLLGRGMMGDGVIEFDVWTRAVDQAGYRGPVEVEIFNQQVWDTPGDEVVALARERFEQLIAPHLTTSTAP